MNLAALMRAYQDLPRPEQEQFAALVRAHEVFNSAMLVRELARRQTEIDSGAGPDSSEVGAAIAAWKVSEPIVQSYRGGSIRFCTAALEELQTLLHQAPRAAEAFLGALAGFAADAANNGHLSPADDVLSVCDESGRTDYIVLIQRAVCVCWVDEMFRKVRMLAFRRALE